MAKDPQKIADAIERAAFADLFAAASPATVQALGLACDVIDDIQVLACRAVPMLALNRAMAGGVGRIVTSSGIEDAVRWLEAYGNDRWMLQQSPTAHPSLFDEAVRRFGLTTACSGWAKFARIVGEGDACPMDGGVRRVVGDRAEMFGHTVQSGYALPPAFAPWFAALVGRAGWTCLMAFAGDRPIGASALYASGEAAWMGISIVLPDHRRAGVQRRMIANRIAEAARLGVTLLTTETAQPSTPDDAGFSSYRNQQRAGFRQLYTRINYQRT